MAKMNPKALVAPVLLLAILAQLASTVYGCVNLFAAQGETNGVFQQTWLDGKLWDNPDSSGDPVCTLSSYSPYNFNCATGYSASLDIYANVVSYSTPDGAYSFAVDYTECGDSSGGGWCSTYQGCVYGCSEGTAGCFAYDCTQVNYGGCSPGA